VGKPWGEQRYPTGAPTLPTRRQFTGQINDSEIGLYFYNARYYSSAIGRFLSADTIVPDPNDPQQLNRYAYGLNNPVKYTDPTGHDVDCGNGDSQCKSDQKQIKSTIRINHGYERDDGEFEHKESSGTVIAPQTVLTHNHFEPPVGSPTSRSLSGSKGKASFDKLGFTVDNRGTLLLHSTSKIINPAAKIASRSVIDNLKEGDVLSAVLFDDRTGNFFVQQFSILEFASDKNARIAILNDPDNLITAGDSGGGVFFNGELVGNVWSYAEVNDKRIGRSLIALMPNYEEKSFNDFVNSINE
jgi:RHS repeat-associated protein